MGKDVENKDDKQLESLRLESLKMIKEWSVWLVVIQTSICTLLWNVIKEKVDATDNAYKIYQLVSLHSGWLAFAVSVIIGVLIVISLPMIIETLKTKLPDETILNSQLKFLGWKLERAIKAEFFFFLAGVILVVIFMALRILAKNP